MTDELKQEIESARELARTGDYNEHPCEVGYAETIVDLADRITALEAEVKTALHREAETTARYDAKIDALEAENERLRGAGKNLNWYAGHTEECGNGTWSEPIECDCGYTDAWKQWSAALGVNQ